MAPRTARALPWASRALRAGVYLVLGGVIAAGYGVLVSGLVQLARAAPQVPMALTVALTVIAVPLALVPPFLAPVRDLGIAAARTFLDVDLPTTSARLGHDDRLRAAGYFVAHLLTGALATLALLFGIPYAVGLIGWTLGSRGDGFRLSAPDLGGWGVPVALLVLLALPLLALLGRALLRALAVPLLGPGAGERELAERQRRLVLAERNRVARELHDGVGHALAITTMQASVAEAALDADTDVARAALAEIARVGRQAMADLDRSLAVLRDEDDELTARTPRPTLADLPGLATAPGAAAGHEVRVRGAVEDLAGLDPLVSREAYQLLAEAVVNGQRHGTGPVDVDWWRADGALTLEVRNAVGRDGVDHPRDGGGRGLVGMRERATLVGARLDAGPEAGAWLVRLTITEGLR